jgi:hypothetical protein
MIESVSQPYCCMMDFVVSFNFRECPHCNFTLRSLIPFISNNVTSYLSYVRLLCFTNFSSLLV